MTPSTPPTTEPATTTDHDAGDRHHDGYHHGNLPNALRAAAVEVIDERGLGGFSLREVARRAGVSHTAPAHHFSDSRGLLTSVAAEGFDALHDAMQSAAADIDDPVARLAAIGAAYVELAHTHASHCDVMFRMDVVNPDDSALLDAGMRSYAVLEGTVQSLVDAEQLDVDLDDATWLCWATMQGLVTLAPKLDRISQLKGKGAVGTRELVERFTGLLVGGLRGRP